MNKILVAISLLLSALLESQVVTATYFINNGDANCTYPVTLTVSDVSCYTKGTTTEESEEEGAEVEADVIDSEYCTFGDYMFVSGEITLEENLPSSEMCVTTKVCVLGYVCRTYKETMDVCNAVGVSNEADGTACPNAGTFYFGSTAKIPGRSFMRLGSGWGVTVKVIAEDCNQYKNYQFSCQTSFSTISSDEAYSNTNTMMISGAALLGVAAAIALFVQRRRLSAAQQSESNDNEPQQHGFEMMNDKSAVLA